MSSEDHIDMDSEPIPQESAGTGNKRKRATTSSSSALPPKPKKKMPKRAEVWQHFTQTDDDLTKSTCKYCLTEIGCDTVLVGTSPMKSHLKRCKAFKDFVERGKQQVLSSDNSV
ncbi:predicted protein [Arabidopsis lyrata subsp. lyrata]|uniref:Predicted protein n=1 Tax=Arabidopsis lyrata subsp. lyrata TaxID=81972 RepID=D7LC08_ARALL|nr:predicted protein [Arabidopsis lyrata subsp. lyrata]